MKKAILFLCTACVLVFAEVITGAAQPYSIEVPYTSARGQIFVQANVGGIEGKYLFDTGAPTVITHSRAARGHGGVVSTVDATDANGNSVDGLQVVDVGAIIIGRFKIEGVQAAVMDEGNPLETILGVDGIIGFNLFPEAVIRFDSRRGVIVIASAIDTFAINPRNAIPMQGGGGYTFIDVNLGYGITEKVMFDTGSAAFFELERGTLKRIAGQPVADTIATVYGFDNAGAAGYELSSEHYRLRFGELRVGRGKFADVVTTSMTGPSSRLGAQLIHHGYVTIDYPRGMFYFEPFVTTPVGMYEPDWDVTTVVVGNHLEVGMVWDSADPRVDVGDRVIAVGDVRYDDVDAQSILSTNACETEKTENKITIRKFDGMEYTITIYKR